MSHYVILSQLPAIMLALAFLVPLTTEAFDLSIGAIAALALLIVNKIALETDLPQGLGALIAIGACLVIGWVNGFIVVKLRVNSFIATHDSTFRLRRKFALFMMEVR